MLFPTPLLHGHLLRRYKRFFADVQLADGSEVVAHCPNPGSMLDVAVINAPVAISETDNPKRKLRYTWEMIQLGDSWVGVHTGRTNALVAEGLTQDRFAELLGYDTHQAEVKTGISRLDFLLSDHKDGALPCFVEVKNVTLARGNHAAFPDSVTVRGQKHLDELTTIATQGEHRAVMLFLVNREDCDTCGPADDIDPEYGRRLRHAADQGVEILAYRAKVSPKQVTVDRSIPMVW